MTNFAVTPSIDNFLSQYQSEENQTKAFIETLNQFTTNFQANSFLSNLTGFTDNLQKMYDQIGNSLEQQCLNKDSNMAIINSIRQNYADKLNSANQLPGSFLNTELNQMKNFLNLTQKTVFSIYDGIPFC